MHHSAKGLSIPMDGCQKAIWTLPRKYLTPAASQGSGFLSSLLQG